MIDAEVRESLDVHAGRLLERHLSRSKEWFPHELVPWGSGRDFAPGQDSPIDGEPLPVGVSSALFVNLLTEDNLPHYFHVVASAFGADTA
ncbi:MAG: acyl-ACP desaturase, partial [Acidimicrobiales bacterium]